MWTRKDLKTRAKARMSFNYWKCVFVAVIVAMLAGGGAIGSSVGNSSSTWVEDKLDQDEEYSYQGESLIIRNIKNEVSQMEESVREDGMLVAVVIIVAIIVLVAIFIALAAAMLLNCFLLNPLVVGCKRFFYRNLNEKAQIKEICFNFDYSYLNGVKVMFFVDLYSILWTLLFIIPGIVKSYEYKMIPYILAEQPDIDKEAAFAISRQMMDGNKWNMFVLDLSFLGWQILNVMTFGILGIFYVNPYVEQTHAALYEVLKMNYKQMEQPQI